MQFSIFYTQFTSKSGRFKMWRWILALSCVNFIYGEKFQDLQFLFVNGFKSSSLHRWHSILNFFYPHSNNSSKYEAFYFNETSKLLSHPDYDADGPTMLYCYGYTESVQRSSTQTILQAYIARGGYNLLVVEWSNYNDGNYYFEAIPNSRVVGDRFGKKLWSMKSEGFNLDNFHLVG